MMRALACLIGVTFAAPVHAQQLGVDPQIVRDCFASTPIGERAPRCLGQASNQCQLQPGGQSSIGVSECIQAETTQWDVLLNSEYKSTRASFRADDAAFQSGTARADALLQAQRAWIAFRDAECGLRYTAYLDGTMRGVVHANCMMVMTAERTIELRDMRGDG